MGARGQPLATKLGRDAGLVAVVLHAYRLRPDAVEVVAAHVLPLAAVVEDDYDNDGGEDIGTAAMRTDA
jgi:hypothetical protein